MTPSPDGTLCCAVLPHGTLILSVLQGPFLKLDQLQNGIRDERRIAMESFETIFRTRFPDDEVRESIGSYSLIALRISRQSYYCMQCCNVAMIPPSGLRLRALNGIHGLLGSRDIKLNSSTIASQSLVAGFLYLLAVSQSQI